MFYRIIPTAILVAVSLLSAQAGEPGTLSEARGRHGMVVSVSPPATEAGLAILKAGGNAVDAAIAVEFALAVTWPAAGNIGGGGFMIVHPPDGRDVVCIDYRETAPGSSNGDDVHSARRQVHPQDRWGAGNREWNGNGARTIREAGMETSGHAGGETCRRRIRDRRGSGEVDERCAGVRESARRRTPAGVDPGVRKEAARRQ